MTHGKSSRRRRTGGSLRLSAMRALAHPLRLRLLELFAERPRTTKQLAAVLGAPPTRLYHHVHVLERAGLLRLREIRRKRGTHEKYYEVATSVLQQGPIRAKQKRGTGGRQVAALAAAALGAAQLELAAVVAGRRRSQHGGKSLIMRVQISSPAVADRVRKQLVAVVNRQVARRRRAAARPRTASGDAGGFWSLTVLLLPPGMQARSPGESRDSAAGEFPSR